jgi:hypothetical protein
MTHPEIIDQLLRMIDKVLNSGQCESNRFALVIWCDCVDYPLFIGSNLDHKDDLPRVIKILRQASEKVLEDIDFAEGHA